MNNYTADVIIIGGGPAGACAALAAAGSGAKVLLLEKLPYFGGMATAARVHSLLTFHGKKGHKIVGGIPQEIIDRLKTAEGTPGHIIDTVGVAYSVTPTDPDKIKIVLQDMLQEAGVNYLLEAIFTGVDKKGERIASISGIYPGGVFTASAPIFIDASGEGALAAAAGAPFETGNQKGPMPATLIFNAGGVDLSQVFDYAEKNPRQFHHETLFQYLRKSPGAGISGFFSIWQEAGLSIPRDRLLFYGALNPGEVSINSTRVINFNPLAPSSINRSYHEALKQVYEIFRFLKEKVPGFSRSLITNIAPHLGVREVRRITGRYVLTGEDLAAGRRFNDEIALGGFPIDIHKPSGRGIETASLGGEGFYGIPYPCLLPLKVENLLITGKCFSAQFSAHASARVQATAMAMGQAAGAAAALAAKKRKNPPEISPHFIRQQINDLGGILQPDKIEDLIR